MANDKTEYNKIEQVEEDIEVFDGSDPDVQVSEEDSKKRLKAVTKAKKTKRGLMDRLVTGLIGPNGIPGIGKYVWEEVFIPGAKDTAGSIIRGIGDGIAERYFGRDGAPTKKYDRGYGGRSYYNQTPYNRSYGNRADTKTKRNDYRSAYNPSETIEMERGMNVDNFVIETREEARDVLDGLKDHILEYGVVTVADYYDLIGIEPKYTDNNFGWDNLSGTSITPTRGGFVLLLPPVDVV